MTQLDALKQIRTLVIKSINAIDTGTFVISSKNEEVFWVFDLVGEQEANGFQTLLSTVHVVSEKQVIGFRRESTVFK